MRAGSSSRSLLLRLSARRRAAALPRREPRPRPHAGPGLHHAAASGRRRHAHHRLLPLEDAQAQGPQADGQGQEERAREPGRHGYPGRGPVACLFYQHSVICYGFHCCARSYHATHRRKYEARGTDSTESDIARVAGCVLKQRCCEPAAKPGTQVYLHGACDWLTSMHGSLENKLNCDRRFFF